MDDDSKTEAIVQTVERIGMDTVQLLQEVRESLRENLEQVEWRWHHVRNRLATLETQLRQPADEVTRSVARFGTELRETSAEVLGALRDFTRH